MSNITSKISLLFVISLGITESISSQSVQNVYATQEGNDILVNYTLETSFPCEVSLLLSYDNGVTWQGPLSDCTGDVGKNISGGQKQIKWNVLASREQLVGNGFQFKIKATGITIFEPEMIFVEGGTFQMGNNSSDSDAIPLHSVQLSSFSMGKYEVTQAQWKAVMGSNPSYFLGCDQCPVENVSWNDVQEFIIKLNHLTGKSFRLPTETEWEYAARGGRQSNGYTWSGSNEYREVAWIKDNSNDQTHAVGIKKSNELGIYDMSGNVWEWCADWYGFYNRYVQTNPKGPSSGDYRIFRGSGWNVSDSICSLSYRGRDYPKLRSHKIGFRLVLS
jgi:formylglycine-generating enzyme required for sulfatase activity